MRNDEKPPGWLILLGVVFVVSLFLFVFQPWKPTPPPEPKPKIILPDAENIGEQVGDRTGRFGRGFIKGVRTSTTRPVDEK